MHLIFLPREEKNSERERIKQAGGDVFSHGGRGTKEPEVGGERERQNEKYSKESVRSQQTER